MKKTTILGAVLAVALAASLVGNICLWNSLKRKNTEYMAVMARLEEELAQGKEAQDTLRQELEQTRADLNKAESQREIPVDAPVWIIDPDTGLPILAPGNGDPSINEGELEQEPEDLLNGGGTGNGGNTGNNGGAGGLDGLLDFSGAGNGKDFGKVGTESGDDLTSDVPNYNPFA